MNTTTIIGVAASILTATSLIPQLVKLLRNKEGGDLSMLMLVILFAGLGCWTWYGLLKNDWIIVASNSFSMVLNAAIGWLTVRYRE